VSILEEKDTHIAALGVAVAAALATTEQSESFQRHFKTYQQLRKKQADVAKCLTDHKTDIQNLLVAKQADSELLNEYRKDIRELQAERTEAKDEVKNLSHKLEKRNNYVVKLQKIIESQVSAADGYGACSGNSCVPLAMVNHMVA
jgi:peptidoglycan hydrolase CwlO-like protein